VIFPIERLQELAGAGVLGGLTWNFFSFNRLQHGSGEVRAHGIADAVAMEEKTGAALLVPA
jgi:hypothetical protein